MIFLDSQVAIQNQHRSVHSKEEDTRRGSAIVSLGEQGTKTHVRGASASNNPKCMAMLLDFPHKECSCCVGFISWPVKHLFLMGQIFDGQLADFWGCCSSKSHL